MSLTDLVTFGIAARRRKQDHATAVTSRNEREFQRLHETSALVLQVSAAGSVAAFAVVTAATHQLGKYGQLLAVIGAALAIPALYSIIGLLVFSEDEGALENKRTLVRFALVTLFFILEVGLAIGSTVWFAKHV